MTEMTAEARADLVARCEAARAHLADLEAQLGEAPVPTLHERTSLLDEVEAGIWSYSIRTRRVAYVNPAMLRIFGRSREDFGGENATLLPWLDVDEEALRTMRAARLRGQSGAFEARVIRPDGEVRWCRFQAHPVPGPGGEVERIDALVLDITEQRRTEEALQRSERRFRRIVDCGWDHTATFDGERRITYASGTGEELTGWTHEEYLALPVAMRVHPDDLGVVAGAWRDALATPGATAHGEARVLHKNGHYIWVETVFINLLHDPDVGAVVAKSRNITARKEAAEALARAHAELEQRVAEATEGLSAANAELVRAAQAKDAFFANMSHELRTPLNAVLGLSEALREEIYGPLAEKQRQALTRIEQSGRHLLALIGDILDLAKLQSGKATLEATDVRVSEVCRASLAMIEGLSRHKRIGVSMQISDPFAVVSADERRLKQVLVNLLGNAVKFTPEGGSIGLDVELDNVEGEVRFSVWDNGIGISPEALTMLFQPFVQVDTGLARSQGGTGLGLSLVRALVDLHGGSVSVESELGKGSRFTVRLPTRRRGEQTPPQGIPRALIVEDSEVVAAQLARYLGEVGLESVVHERAEGALERAAVEQPSVILLDILLPAEVGWNLLRDLRADIRTAHIPVVVVSVLDARERALSLGAVDHVRKPVDRDTFHAAVARATGGRTPDRPALIACATCTAPAPAPATPRRILVAEDDDMNVHTVVDFLRAKGFEVFRARDGREAIDLCGAVQPDAVLMDIQMPVMDGLAAMRALKADARPSLNRVPIVALTALAMEGDRERCLAAGADEYLSKPVSLKQLATILEALMARGI